MSRPTEARFTYSNKLGKIFRQGLEEIMGHSSLETLLNLARLTGMANNGKARGLSFEDLSKTLVALEKIYGQQGGRGVALRTGRACFKYSLQEFGTELGLNDAAFRLLPTDRKLLAEMERLAEVFNTHSDQRVRVQEGEEKILWQIERCPMCWDRREDEPICHLMVGFVQEAAYWVSGGKMFGVEEKSCIAQGDRTCTIAIDKQPFP